MADNISSPPSSAPVQRASSVSGCRQAEKCNCALDLLALGGTFLVSKNHTSINDAQKLHSQLSQHVEHPPGSVPSPALPIPEQGCWEVELWEQSWTQMSQMLPCSHKGQGCSLVCLSHSARAHYLHSSRCSSGAGEGQCLLQLQPQEQPNLFGNNPTCTGTSCLFILGVLPSFLPAVRHL